MTPPFNNIDFPKLPQSTVSWRPFYLEPVAGSGERIAIGVGFQNGKGIDFERTLTGKQLRALFGQYATNIAGFINMIESEVKGCDSLQSFTAPFSGAYGGTLHNVYANAVDQIRRTSLEMTSAFMAMQEFEEEDQDDEREVITSVKEVVLSRSPGLGDYFNTSLALGRGRKYRFNFTGQRAAVNISKLYYGSGFSNYTDRAKARILDLVHLRNHDQEHRIESTTRSGRIHYDLILFHDDFNSPRLTKRNVSTVRDSIKQLEEEADKVNVRLKPVLMVDAAADWIVKREAA